MVGPNFPRVPCSWPVSLPLHCHPAPLSLAGSSISADRWPTHQHTGELPGQTTLKKIQPLKIAMGVPLLLYSLLLSFKTTTEAADIRFLSLLSYKRPFRSTYHFGTRHLTSYNETFSSSAFILRLVTLTLFVSQICSKML